MTADLTPKTLDTGTGTGTGNNTKPTTKSTSSKNIYLEEEDLKEEIRKIQMTQKINKLLIKQKELKKYAKYTWELQELENIDKEIQELLNKGANPDYSLERFGEMILLLLNNIVTKSNFAGYSWRDEFFGDATEKILKYIHNFDATKISKITGQPVKAFAYLTQIITMSFLYIINKHKNEIELMKNNIPLLESSSKMDEILKTIRNNDVQEDENIDFDIVIDLRQQSYPDAPPFKYNNKLYSSVYDILKEVRENNNSVKCVMHKNNIIPLPEYQKILDLKFETINLTRFVHKNSFPAKQKKIKKTLEEEWGEVFSTIVTGDNSNYEGLDDIRDVIKSTENVESTENTENTELNNKKGESNELQL